MVIHTPCPRNRFGIHFVMLSRLWRRSLDQKMAAAGFADISWSPLIHLAESGDGVSQKALAALVGIDGASLVRLLDTLESRGHIQRCPCPDDRRVKLVMLTADGQQMVHTIREHLERIEREMLQDLDDEQLLAMLGGFDRIKDRLALMAESTGHGQ